MRVFTLPSKKLVQQVRFTADGTELGVLWNSRPWFRMLSIMTGELTPWRTHPVIKPTCLEFSADNRLVALGGPDGVARVYERGSIRPMAEHQLGYGETVQTRLPIQGIDFAPTTDPKQQWLAIVGSEFWLWNSLTQQYHVAPVQHHYTSVAFSPTMDAVFVSRNTRISKYSLRPHQEVWFNEYEPWISKVVVSPDAAWSVALAPPIMDIINPLTADRVRRIRLKRNLVREVAFIPGTHLLCVADGSQSLRCYDIDSGSLAREYDWGIGSVRCVTFSRDGALGAVAGESGQIVVWDVE